MIQTYTYSEARQKLSSVLDAAESKGKVLIRRKDGRIFALVPENSAASPLDVPSIHSNISTKEMVALVKSERGRARGLKPRP